MDDGLTQTQSLAQEPTLDAHDDLVQGGAEGEEAGPILNHRPSLSLTSLADLVRSRGASPAVPPPGSTAPYSEEEEDDGGTSDSPRGSAAAAADREAEERAEAGRASGAAHEQHAIQPVGSLDRWGDDAMATLAASAVHAPHAFGAGGGRGHGAASQQQQQQLATASALPPPPPAPSTLDLQSAAASLSLSSAPSPAAEPSPNTTTPAPPSSALPLPDRSLSLALEDDTGESWLHHLKHFFILSSSGKPIYSYHGEENSLAGLMALITALVSVVQDQGDTLQHMLSGSTLIVFVSRGPLLLVATSRMGEPILTLQRQLELLYRQVLLVITTGLERLILRNPAYDPRTLLQGVGSTLRALVHQVRLDPAYLMGALRPFPVPAADRALLQQVLAEALKPSPAYYAILMIGSHILAYEKAKAQPALEPLDVLLLANFITSNPACRSAAGEVFCPVCLPGYNSEAFLHAHIDFLDSDAGVYLVLLAGSSDTFHALSAARAAVDDGLTWHGLLPRLQQAERQVARQAAAATAPGGGGLGGGGGSRTSSSGSLAGQSGAGISAREEAPTPEPPVRGDVGVSGHVSIDALPRPMGGRLGCTPLWHFMARFPARHQMLASLPCPMFSSSTGRQQLACAYAQLHSLVMDCPDPARPNRMVWIATEQQAMLASLDLELELYLVMDPLTDEATATVTADGLRKHLSDKRVLADLLLAL